MPARVYLQNKKNSTFIDRYNNHDIHLAADMWADWVMCHKRNTKNVPDLTLGLDHNKPLALKNINGHNPYDRFHNTGGNPYYGPPGEWVTHQVTDMNYLFCSDRLGNSYRKSMLNFDSSKDYRSPDFDDEEDYKSTIEIRRRDYYNLYFNEDISKWNTSSVVNMEYMFWDAANFNKSINKIRVTGIIPDGGGGDTTSTYDAWNTSKVTNMKSMFYEANDFNGNIGGWDVSNVTNMFFMFRNATSFNQPLNSWDVSSVTTMKYMFAYATSFNQPLDSWDVSSVSDMRYMFYKASSFNQSLNSKQVTAEDSPTGVAYTAWNVSSVTYMSSMFAYASSFNQPLNSWDVSSVTDMDRMFYDASASAFNQPLDSWDVSSVTDMDGMFYGASSFNQNLRTWKVNESCRTTDIFKDCPVNTTPYYGLSANDATDLDKQYFNYPLSFDTIPVSGDDNIKNLRNEWFSSNKNKFLYSNGDYTKYGLISDWNTSNVTDMSQLFKDKEDFNEDISKWNTSKVNNMSKMFAGCSKFNRDISSRVVNKDTTKEYTAWDTSSVVNMSYMFQDAHEFNLGVNNLGLNWTVSSVTNMNSMFKGASKFNKKLTLWNVPLVTDMNYMFYGATLFKQNLRYWNISSTCTFENFTKDGSKLSKEPYNGRALKEIRYTPAKYYYLYFNSGTTVKQVENTNPKKLFELVDIYLTDTGPNNTMFTFNSNNYGPIEAWDTSEVTSFNYEINGTSYGLFEHDRPTVNDTTKKIDTESFNYQLRYWNTSNVTNMSKCFKGCKAFNMFTFSWNLSSLTDSSSMYEGCEALISSIDILKATNITNTSRMFKDAKSFNQQIFSPQNNFISSCTELNNLEEMFMNCEKFNNGNNYNQISNPIRSFKFSKETNLRNMFNGCTKFNQAFQNSDYYPTDTSKVTNMSRMFANCKIFTGIGLEYLNVINVTDMSYMFHNCTNLNKTNKLDLGWYQNTRNVTTFEQMFVNSGISNNPFDEKFKIKNWLIEEGATITNMFSDGSTPEINSFNFIPTDLSPSTIESNEILFNLVDKWLTNSDQTVFKESITTEKWQDIAKYDYKIYGPINKWKLGEGVTDTTFKRNVSLDHNDNMINFEFQASFSNMGNKYSLTTTDSNFRNLFNNLDDFKNIYNYKLEIGGKSYPIKSIRDFRIPNMLADKSIEGASSTVFFNFDDDTPTNLESQKIKIFKSKEEITFGLFENGRPLYDTNSNGVIGTTNFNTNLSDWDVQYITNFTQMFKGCTNFNKDISGWNVHPLNTFTDMFKDSGITTAPKDYFDSLEITTLTPNIRLSNPPNSFETHHLLLVDNTYARYIINGNSDNIDTNNIKLELDPNDTSNGAKFQNGVPNYITSIFGNLLDIKFQEPKPKIWHLRSFRNTDIDGEQEYKNYSKMLILKVPLGDGTINIQKFRFYIKYCLHKNTIIRTDQGDIEIQYLTKSNTISNKAILGISKTINSEKKMILIKKNSLGENLPSKDTICSHNHSILYAGKMRNSEDLLHINGVSEILDDSDYIYNVLTEKHSIMYANNLPVETLHPETDLAKFYLEVWNMDLETETKNEITNIFFKN